MSLNLPSNELTGLREQFLNWKQLYPHKQLPKHLWDHALALLSKYSLNDIAKSIGTSPQYLRLKQKKRLSTHPPKMHFVEIEPSQVCDLNQIRMQIRDHKGLAVELSFQGSVDQIFPLISTLLKEENSCSK
jgi:hypothetical protein